MVCTAMNGLPYTRAMNLGKTQIVSGRLWRAAVVLGAAAVIGGCSPVTFSVTLGEGDRPLRESPVLAESDGPSKVVMIEVQGLIADARVPGLLSSGANPVDEVVARLQRAERDASVRAILLRINSPGGTVTGSDVLYRELRAFRERSGKPIVVSMSEIAASGGYYTALAGDHIVANPTTITGSIGVIIPTFNFSGGMNRLGIVARSIKSGANKDLANPFEPMREGQYEVLQTMVDEFYARFKGLVVERRPKLKASDVADATDGRVFSGVHAQSIGLVDEIGGIPEAFAAAKLLAGVERAKLVQYTPEGSPRPRTAYAEAPAMAGGVNLLQLNVPAGISTMQFNTSGVYYIWIPPAAM